MVDCCTDVSLPFHLFWRPWNSAEEIKENSTCAFPLKVDLWGADSIVSRLQQDSHGFPIIFPEMTISNSVSSPAPTRLLRGKTRNKKPQCERRWGGWNAIPSRIVFHFASNTMTTLTLIETSYIKYFLPWVSSSWGDFSFCRNVILKVWCWMTENYLPLLFASD